MSDGPDYRQQEELEQQEYEEQAAALDRGKTNAVKDSAQGKENEQKQSDRNEQQPLHAVV